MISALLLSAIPMPAVQDVPPTLETCDVVWNSPSEDAAGSMPIGNGETVLNVWVEKATGDLLFYVARGDAFSEISRILKLGRVRVSFSESPWKNARDFRQHLHLRDGFIELAGGGLNLRLFVDPAAQVVRLAGTSASPMTVRAELESWRTASRRIPKEEQTSAWAVHDAPFDLEESADVFMRRPETLEWYHRNETSVVPKLLDLQSLTGLRGAFDPLIDRTFGGRISGAGMKSDGARSLRSAKPTTKIDLRVVTHSAQTKTVEEWRKGLDAQASRSGGDAETRNRRWWNDYWNRSWVFVEGDPVGAAVPSNRHPVSIGKSSANSEPFPGEIRNPKVLSFPMEPRFLATVDSEKQPAFASGLTLSASIKPTVAERGRIFDKITPGGSDGFLFDNFGGDGLRLIVGGLTLNAPHCLRVGDWNDVVATYNAVSGEASIYVAGRQVAHRAGEQFSPITRGYMLQRYVQACEGRSQYPIKFNGGGYTVEPTAAGKPFNADWRAWGDCHWFQNVRHMTHPMFASGDIEMTDPFFRLYERVRPLAESRAKAYHGSEGAYFPETMTIFGTYSGGDYGWDRKGHAPKDVLCPWWQYAWNQGPELVGLMLDRWDYSRDEAFLKERALPMAEAVLKYFDTRFRKDAEGRIVLDPTQVVETYWEGVENDMPSTAGLIAVTERLTRLPARLTSDRQRAFFAKMRKACPELPLEVQDGARELAPAQKYVPKRSNVENGELYAVWPFRLVDLARPALLPEAQRAYAHRGTHLDVGWGYDGNVAALLGMADESARILQLKVRNSHPAYRWPATWGPNFDWLPDQNHGGNLLEQTQLMLMQSDPLEQGGAIRLLPTWPKEWNADFRLHAPGKTTVRCVYRNGRIETLEVTPASRLKDVILPAGLTRP